MRASTFPCGQSEVTSPAAALFFLLIMMGKITHVLSETAFALGYMGCGLSQLDSLSPFSGLGLRHLQGAQGASSSAAGSAVACPLCWAGLH